MKKKELENLNIEKSKAICKEEYYLKEIERLNEIIANKDE